MNQPTRHPRSAATVSIPATTADASTANILTPADAIKISTAETETPKSDTQTSVANTQNPAVRMDFVSKSQTTPLGRKILARNVSFSLAQGKIGALFGFSGSGKSVVLEMIAGLSTPDSGIVEVFGQNLATLSPDELLAFRRKNISIVFASVNLAADLRVRENLLLPFLLENKSVDENELTQLTKIFGINEIMHFYPAELTIYEERKVALARAVLTRKPLLLVFLPGNNLNANEQREILSLMQLATREYGITVLFSTDLPHSTSIAQTAFLMYDAQLVGEIARPSARAILFAIDALES